MISIASALGSIVLVHGGFVDGSGWEDVYRILKKDGYDVSIVQNPTTSRADDVSATKRVIDATRWYSAALARETVMARGMHAMTE